MKQIKIGEIFRQSSTIFPQVFSRAWPMLLAVILPSLLIQQFLMAKASVLSTSENARIVAAIIAIIVSLVETLFVMLIAPAAAAPFVLKKTQIPSLGSHVRINLGQVAIETFRAIGQVAKGVLMLVYPGLQRFFQYLMVPYIVQFNPDYSAGKVDALELSKSISKGNLLKILVIYLILMVLSLATQLGLTFWNVFTEPLVFLIFAIGYVAIDILTHLVLFLVYSRLITKES